MRRVITASVGSLVVALLLASPASARIFPPNTAGCSGSATITAKDGTVYKVDSSMITAKVPRDGTAMWQGSTKAVVTDHKGGLGIDLKVFKITPYKWGAQNAEKVKSKSGTVTLPSAVKLIPPGKYTLTGTHAGKGGSCSGDLILDVQGGWASSPAGPVTAVLTMLSALGMLSAAKVRP